MKIYDSTTDLIFCIVALEYGDIHRFNIDMDSEDLKVYPTAFEVFEKVDKQGHTLAEVLGDLVDEWTETAIGDEDVPSIAGLGGLMTAFMQGGAPVRMDFLWFPFPYMDTLMVLVIPQNVVPRLMHVPKQYESLFMQNFESMLGESHMLSNLINLGVLQSELSTNKDLIEYIGYHCTDFKQLDKAMALLVQSVSATAQMKIEVYKLHNAYDMYIYCPYDTMQFIEELFNDSMEEIDDLDVRMSYVREHGIDMSDAFMTYHLQRAIKQSEEAQPKKNNAMLNHIKRLCLKSIKEKDDTED